MGFTSDFKRVDQTSVSIPYFTLTSDRSAQRLAIDRAGALMSNAYLTAEQAKARALGGLPVHVFNDSGGDREKVKNHPLARICNRRWNPIMTAQTGWQWTSLRRDSMGSAYARVEWDRRGEPLHFWPIEAPVETFYSPGARVSPVRYKVGPGDKFTPPGIYLRHEILHFPTCISTDGGVTGRSFAELAAAEIGLSIDLTRFYANIISKGFNPGGYLQTDDELDENDVAAIKKKNDILSGPDHAGELRIFDRGLKYSAVGSTMAEADIVKQEEFILQSVARAVYVQPNKVFDFSRATYSNIEEAAIAFVTDTMTNEITAIEAEVNSLFEIMGQPDTYLKFEMRGLLRGSFKAQIEAFVAAVYGGIYKRSEVRDLLELPFVEGSDELLQPTAYIAIDRTTGEAKPVPKALASGVRALTDGADPLAPVLADARDRIARRLEKDGDCEKTREFAEMVLTPVRDAYALAGVAFDLEETIEEACRG